MGIEYLCSKAISNNAPVLQKIIKTLGGNGVVLRQSFSFASSY